MLVMLVIVTHICPYAMLVKSRKQADPTASQWRITAYRAAGFLQNRKRGYRSNVCVDSGFMLDLLLIAYS